MKTNRMQQLMGVAIVVSALQFAGRVRADDASPAQASARERTANGTITAVNANQHTLKVRHFLFTKDFNLADGCAIAVGNNAHATAPDLKSGMEVKVQYTDADGVLIADRIEQKKETRTGSIEALDAKNGELTLDEGTFKKHIRTGDNCKYVMNGDKSGSLKDLKLGQRVTVEYVKNGDQLMALQIEQPRATFIGSLDAIDTTTDTVKARHLVSNKKFNLADDCRIVINGNPDGKLRDLRIGQDVAIDYRDVNGVYVATRIAPANAAEGSAQSKEMTRAAK